MKIYETRVAPNPRRVRIFLAEKGIDMEYVEINLLKAEHHTPEFKEKNPFSLVPVLEFDNGHHLSETVAICRYFEEIQPEPALFGRTPEEKALVEMWNRRSEFYFFLPTGMCFQHTTDYFKGLKQQIPEWGQLCRSRAEKFFSVLERHFENNEFMTGDYYSIADITTLCALEFSKVNNLRVQPEQKNLQRWLEQMRSRPSYSA
ncbi:glutathione S-transferase [Hahella sp. CCB-MM4]|uniref:glutathione S-transferase family protein n=1 Tax=Hahella sp. (strain CCB-MM4) TaxID=1926491 RepID=UPI000B9AEDCF|nr:glutathione S-transferase [Hahella sp. CCB-MM4]OZG74291.1 glutathione S-transferase [Hahella sp. CCB-MM4]